MPYFKITEKDKNYLMQKDQIMQILIQNVQTPKEIQIKDPFLTLVDQIVGQQISEHVKNILMDRMQKTFKDIHPKTFKDKSSEALQAVGLSKMKAETIRRLSRADIDFNTLKNQDEKTIKDKLMPIKGIGPWTIDMFMFVGLGKRDIFSLKDKGIENALLALYPVDKQALSQFQRYFSPCGSAAQAYLWQYLKEDKETQAKIKKECLNHEHPCLSKQKTSNR